MDKKQRSKKIQKILKELYPTPQAPLVHKDPYTLLVAVILSAHGRDVIVNKVTPILFALADTPEKMIQLTVEEIGKIVRPCGLGPRKALAIWEMSHLLLQNHEGRVPSTFEELEALPGVGHKTASVILSQCFKIETFPVDTHIHRCAKRWGLSEAKNVKQTEKDLKALFPKKDWGALHLQIIYFAREYCQALKHDRSVCPICSWINL